MWQNTRLNLRIFLSRIIVILAVVGGLITWHFFTQPPTLPQSTCGTIVFLQSSPPRPVSNNMQQVENCFSRAYQQCTEKTMEVSEHGVDTGNHTIYWPHQQGNTCEIITQSSSFGLVGNGNTTQTGTCQRMLQKNGGLLFKGCSDSGDIFISG